MVTDIHHRQQRNALLRPAVPAIALTLAVSESTARRLIKNGVVRVVRAGAGLRIDANELERLRIEGTAGKQHVLPIAIGAVQTVG